MVAHEYPPKRRLTDSNPRPHATLEVSDRGHQLVEVEMRFVQEQEPETIAKAPDDVGLLRQPGTTDLRFRPKIIPDAGGMAPALWNSSAEACRPAESAGRG